MEVGIMMVPAVLLQEASSIKMQEKKINVITLILLM